MNKQQEDWKEQFEKDLTELWRLYEVAKEQESLGVRHQIVEAVNQYNDKIYAMEESISKQLSQQKTELIEKIEGLKRNIHGEEKSEAWLAEKEGYNQALEEVINLLVQ